MRRAAVGGGARAGAPPGGALGPDPGRGGQGGRGAGSAGPRPLPAQSAARAPGQGQGGIAAPQAPSPALDLAPDTFVMRVLLEDTGETFQVANCRGDMTVRELKEELDLLVGIPLDLQRLQYLDQGVLMDDATLKFHDVVPGGIISLCIWHYDGWTELVLAAVEGDPSKLSCLGVDEDSLYRTANSQRYERKQCKDWMAQRAFVALYVTSHRGHPDAVQYLLEHGANCLSKTPMGRTALHVAAAMGRLDCINHLLSYGASIHEKDARGETPMSIARRMNRKHSERRMFLFYWMSRLGTNDPKNLIKNKVFLRAQSGRGTGGHVWLVAVSKRVDPGGNSQGEDFGWLGEAGQHRAEGPDGVQDEGISRSAQCRVTPRQGADAPAASGSVSCRRCSGHK
uniref:ankyrin repeat domain-containing protein 60 n=1 Tax=Nyctereutes procyonoides TaxID=34880 RepID=UPI00244386B1|nr:ankyrin repeat domain-containing protein 60 [Nyctereutes procyonoides]